MSSVKKCMLGLAAGAAVFGSVAQAAPTLVVDQQSQPIQTPVSPAVGFSYIPTSNGTKSTLSVYTDGFLFCGNPGGGTSTEAKLEVKHQDKTLNPAAEWKFAVADDMPAITYTGEFLSINANQETSLTCLATSVDGAVVSATREGIFDNGYDSATRNNYSHLVNWIAPSGFDWNTPDWEQVPFDPCSPGANDTPRVVENVACAAVTSVRPAAGTQIAPTRAARLWTATDGTTFTYVFKVDARWGLPTPATPTQMQAPDLVRADDSVSQAAQIAFTVQDAFDKTLLDDGSNSGSYCFLTELPTALDANACVGRPVYPLNGKPFSWTDMVVDPGVNPNGSVRSFYVAIQRPVHGGHPNLSTPVVGVSVLVERAAVAEGADRFSGDNVVFGFMPASNGFGWMRGNQ